MGHDLDDVTSLDDVYDFADEAEELLCKKLDQLIGSNTLLAALDGTLSAKLTPDMIDEDTLDLIQSTIFVEEELSISGDVPAILQNLVESLWGVAQYFRFCGKPITPNWGSEMKESWIPDSIQMLSEAEYTAWVLTEGRKKRMTDEEIFALIGYLCIGDGGDKVIQ